MAQLCTLMEHLEQLILFGQMTLKKCRTEILELIYVCSFTTLPKIGHSKFTCKLTHTTLNLFHNSMFLLVKLQPRLALTFDLNLNRNTSKLCISKYCSQLPEHSHYDKTDLNPFFYRNLSKPIPQWFLAVDIYCTVYENTLKKINSHAYITKSYHEGKPFPIGIFILKRKYSHVHFSDKLIPLRIGTYKFLDSLSDVTYELSSQGGSTLHVHRIHLIPYYPKEPLMYPHLHDFMRFSHSTQFDIPKPIKHEYSDSSPFNSDESLSDEDSSQKL